MLAFKSAFLSLAFVGALVAYNPVAMAQSLAPQPATSADSGITLGSKSKIRGDLRTGDNSITGSTGDATANSGMTIGDKTKIRGDLYTGDNTVTNADGTVTTTSGVTLGDKVKVKGNIYTGTNTVDGSPTAADMNSGVIMGDKTRIKGIVATGDNTATTTSTATTAAPASGAPEREASTVQAVGADDALKRRHRNSRHGEHPGRGNGRQ